VECWRAGAAPAGNRPSLSILLPQLSAFSLGQLLSLYEHRVATSGFVWGINSFDQWGVELGKVGAGCCWCCVHVIVSKVWPRVLRSGGVLTYGHPALHLAPPPPAPQVLANQVRAKVQEARSEGRPLGAQDGFNGSTLRLLNRFLEAKTQPPGPGQHSFPPGLKQ
jgi:glucose-6-phosphate isomerase